jgi:hypothetical protein
MKQDAKGRAVVLAGEVLSTTFIVNALRARFDDGVVVIENGESARMFAVAEASDSRLVESASIGASASAQWHRATLWTYLRLGLTRGTW